MGTLSRIGSAGALLPFPTCRRNLLRLMLLVLELLAVVVAMA